MAYQFLGGKRVYVDCPPQYKPRRSLGFDAKLPAGPFRIGMTWCQFSMTNGYWSLPYIIIARNGSCIVGHVPSLHIAVAIRDALNRKTS